MTTRTWTAVAAHELVSGLLIDIVSLGVLIEPCRGIGLISPAHFYMEHLRPAVSPHGPVLGDKCFRNRVCVVLQGFRQSDKAVATLPEQRDDLFDSVTVQRAIV